MSNEWMSARIGSARLVVAACVLSLAAHTADVSAAIPPAERAALIQLFNSTGGSGWVHTDNWLGADGTECTWWGVGCDAGETHVTMLALPYNNLSGPLSPLTDLTQLEVLIVSYNHISGALPNFGSLASLRMLIVNDNQLGGSIPAFVGFTALQTFDASRNQLTGSIPDLSGLPGISRVLVSNNQLTGVIPSLTGLASLSHFYVDGNQLSGPPPALPDPTSLGPSSGLLCNNNLDPVDSAAWDLITGENPWYLWCVAIFVDGFDGAAQ